MSKRFYSKLPLFLQVQVEGELLTGKSAFDHIMGSLVAVKDLEGLEKYVVFSWLGSATQQGQIHDKKMALVAGLASEPSAEA